MSRPDTFMLRIGACVIWGQALFTAAEAIDNALERDWVWSAFAAVAVVGLVLIGREVWKVAAIQSPTGEG